MPQWHTDGAYDPPMPTANPRINVTLTPAVAAMLRELSRLTKNSQSGIISELLETSLPVFERVCTVLRAASTVQQAAKDDIAAGLDRAQARIESQLGLIQDEMDEVSRPLLEAAEKITRRGAAGARSVASTRAKPLPLVAKKNARPKVATPISNRGVTSTHAKAKPTPSKFNRRVKNGQV
jgi:hypothetical protein